jgi:hypothetical protein
MENVRQELYNTMCRRTYEQGARSIGGDMCMYRGENGLKCAFGQIIPDDRYDPRWEGKNARCIIPRAFPQWTPHIDVISEIQFAHDSSTDPQTFREDFLRKVQTIALELELTPFRP